ncbi:MAG: hypothetical protein ACRD8Z_19890, partial [Nitrososphaeraceae archaeon]
MFQAHFTRKLDIPNNGRLLYIVNLISINRNGRSSVVGLGDYHRDYNSSQIYFPMETFEGIIQEYKIHRSILEPKGSQSVTYIFSR